MNNIKLKKGDEVIVLTGKDKGKIGKIILVKKQVNKAVVAGINKVKKHQKPDNNQAGGIIEKEMPINFSNLAYYDSISKKGVKLGYKFNEKKEKIIFRKDALSIALGRSEILIIRKEISPNPNTSIKTTKIRIAEAKKSFFLSSLRTIVKDLNKSITVIVYRKEES